MKTLVSLILRDIELILIFCYFMSISSLKFPCHYVMHTGKIIFFNIFRILVVLNQA